MLKKLLFIVFIVIGIILIIWKIDRSYFHPYLPDFDLQIRDDITTSKFTIPQNKIDCKKAGGTWKKIGTRPVEECNLPTTDAGKPCLSSNICEGICRADINSDQLRQGMSGKIIKTTGKCSPWVKQIGCFGVVHQGWAGIICID